MARDEDSDKIAISSTEVVSPRNVEHHSNPPCHFAPYDCNVGPAAWRKADDPPRRLRWVGLRPCDPRDRRQRGSARGQMQELAAGGPRIPASPHPTTALTLH